MNASELLDVIKKTAIQQEQQYKTNQDIINEIICVLLSNKNMSVSYGKRILMDTIYALENTPFNSEQNMVNTNFENECEYLKSIAESLNKISKIGIDVFNSSIGTNY